MNSCVWFELYITDSERARAFYQVLLGGEVTELPNPSDNGDQMFALPSNGGFNDYGATGALVKSQTIGPGAGGTRIYFGCDDCAEMLNKAEAAGGKRVQEKVSLGESGAFALAEDSEGNTIGFHSNN